jgi:hypothetical protein
METNSVPPPPPPPSIPVAAVAPAAASVPAPVLVERIVVQQPVLEGGRYYLKGQTIRITAARAAALGDFVAVKPAPAPQPVPTVIKPAAGVIAK